MKTFSEELFDLAVNLGHKEYSQSPCLRFLLLLCQKCATRDAQHPRLTFVTYVDTRVGLWLSSKFIGAMKSDTISDWFLRGHTNLVAFSRFCETNYYLISCAKQTYHPGIVHVEEDSCKATFSLTHRSLAQHPVPQTWAGIGTGASLWSTVPILVRDQDEERDRKTTGGFSMPRPGVGNYGGEKPISLDPSSTARGTGPHPAGRGVLPRRRPIKCKAQCRPPALNSVGKGLAGGSEHHNFHGLVETLFWWLKGEHSTRAGLQCARLGLHKHTHAHTDKTSQQLGRGLQPAPCRHGNGISHIWVKIKTLWAGIGIFIPHL